MEPPHAYIHDIINKDDINEVEIESFDLNLPQVKEIGNSLEDIYRHVMAGEMNVYPKPNINQMPEIQRLLYERIRGISSKGLAYVGYNLSVSAGISKPTPEPQPGDVILDVCLLVKDFPPTVFTLVKDNPLSVDMAKSYNLTLTQGVIKAVRRFTTEQFSAVYGLVHETELNTQEEFQRQLNALRDATSRMCVPDSLKMHEEKCGNIIRSFVSFIASTYSVEDNSDTVWFLSKEQFCILTENIDQQEVVVRTAPSCGGNVLMRDVARRLEKSGPTLLVVESEEQIRIASDQKTCSTMMTLNEWRETLIKGGQPGNIRNMVTSCGECPSMPGLKGRCWKFIPGPEKNITSETLEDQGQDVDHREIRTEEMLAAPNLGAPGFMERVKSLEHGIESRDTEIKKLTDEIEELKRKEFYNMVESLSFGGQSLDSGQGSDTTSLTSEDTKGSTSGQEETKGLLKSLKRRLSTVKLKKKEVRDVHVYVYTLSSEDRTSFITLQCRQQEMDRDRVDTEHCHVTEDGQLTNSQPPSQCQQGSRRFQQYNGTCGNFPIPLPSSPVPQVSQYWETETSVELKKRLELWWRPIMEVGVVEADALDTDWTVHGKQRAWCVRVGYCNLHDPGICTQVWNQKERLRCVTEALSWNQLTPQTLRYGVVVDSGRGRIGFIDTDRGMVLHKVCVEFKATLNSVFGVNPHQGAVTVNMKLISGAEIIMTEEKQKLIYSCLT